MASATVGIRLRITGSGDADLDLGARGPGQRPIELAVRADHAAYGHASDAGQRLRPVPDDGTRGLGVVVSGLLWNLWWFETSHTDHVGHLPQRFSRGLGSDAA